MASEAQAPAAIVPEVDVEEHQVQEHGDGTEGGDDSDFYCRYYVGHKGKFGHEFMEFEFKGDGTMRYANNSGYRGSGIIRKKVVVSPAIIKEVQKIVRESKIVEEDDEQWPEPDDIGRQELEVKDGEEHIAFTCTKLGSTRDIRHSKDPKGLEALYFLVQDLKCLALSLISLHFKVNPIPN